MVVLKVDAALTVTYFDRPAKEPPSAFGFIQSKGQQLDDGFSAGALVASGRQAL